MRTKLTWDTIPDFPDDEELGEVVLGWDRRKEFRSLAELHEPAGMPKINLTWGGRFAPAVRKWFRINGAKLIETPLEQKRKEGTFHAGRRQPTRPARTEVAKAPERSRPVLVRERDI